MKKNKAIYRRFVANPAYIQKEFESLKRGEFIPAELKEEAYGAKEFLIIDKTWEELTPEEQEEYIKKQRPWVPS